MAHPLVGKYESTDLTALPPEDRDFARTEIKDVLSGKGKGKLTPEDRVILLRLWMETFERPSQPATATEIANEHAQSLPKAKADPKKARRIPSLSMPKFTTIRAILSALAILRLSDLAFICCCIGISAAVISFGTQSMRETLRIEDVKRDAEAVVAWIKENGGDTRAEKSFQPAACNKASTDTWKGCIAALSAEGGPFADKKSRFDPSRDLFAVKCDMANPHSVGTIILEKGAVTPGGSSIAYTALDGSEGLTKDLTLRVIVCGRGFHLIKVTTDLTF